MVDKQQASTKSVTKGKTTSSRPAAKQAAGKPAKQPAKAPAKAAKAAQPAKAPAKAAKVAKVTPAKAAKVAKVTKAPAKAVKPAKAAAKAPAKAAAKAPAKAATKAPAKAATKAPARAATKAPAKAATKAPAKAVTKAPAKAVTKAPAKAATKAPAKAAKPVKAPAKAPVKAAKPERVVVQPPQAAPADTSSGGADGVKRNAFVFRQRQRLLDLRDDLINSMSGVTRDTLRNAPEGSEASGSGMHQGDAGSDAYDRDFALSVLAKEQDALYEIEEALKRIERGSYGICEISGRRIPQTRLEAMPFARLTVECQAEWEKENGQRRFRPSADIGFGGVQVLDEEDEAAVSLDEEEE